VTSQSWASSEDLVSAETVERFRRLGALPCTWPVANQTGMATTKMSEVLRLHWPDMAAGSTVVIQATSAGLRPSEPGEVVAGIVPCDRLKKDALAYDLVYTGRNTPYLQAARQHGVRAAGGLGMLVVQGAYALSLWLNIKPDIALMRTAAEQALLVGNR
jgi:shikimate 5-dehydrogenase